MSSARILVGDVRERLSDLAEGSVRCCVTSPPYWGLRDYGHDGQIGLEQTPEAYVEQMVAVFREVRRVLAEDGTLWLNLGDSYSGSGPSGASYQSETTKRRVAGGLDGSFRVSGRLADRGLTYAEKKPVPPPGLKHKDLVGIPWRVAFALQTDGWYLRQDIIWAKPNVMPESVRDRCTKSHEYVFLLTKSSRYFFDHVAIKEPVSDASLKRAKSGWKSDRPSTKTTAGGIDVAVMGERFVNPEGRNKRSVWTVPPASFRGAHFAVMPEALVEPCVLAGSRPGDLVLDPFAGSGTVGVVSLRHGRDFVGVELNPEYADLARERIRADAPLLNEVSA